jgi:hypothetical protein
MAGLLNEAPLDRVIRIVVGIVLLYLGLSGMVAGTWGLVSEILGVILLITGIIGVCPIYLLLGLRTNWKQSTKS